MTIDHFICIYAVMCDEKQEGIVGLGIQNGALSFIRKPVSANDLIRLCRRFITAHQKKCKVTSAMELVETGSVCVNQLQDNIANIPNPDATAKTTFKWTFEHHSKFMDAVNDLGGIDSADAVPKKILERMNVLGITRENVASHLQKYRKLWRFGSQRINKLARHDKEYRRQLDASSSYSSHHASSNGCHLGVSSSKQDESLKFYQQKHTEAFFAKNKNEDLQVGGLSYLMSELQGDYFFPGNDDLTNVLNFNGEGGEQQFSFFENNIDQEIAAQMQFASDPEDENYTYAALGRQISDLPAFNDYTAGQDNSGGNHLVDFANDFYNQRNITQQSGNDYGMNYNCASVEREELYDYIPWCLAGTSQQSFNQQYSSPTQQIDNEYAMSYYLMSEPGDDYILPKNDYLLMGENEEDNNSSCPLYSAQGGEQQQFSFVECGMDQEIDAQMPFASEGDNHCPATPICHYLALDDNTVGHDNSGDNHMVHLIDDFTNHLNINQPIGNGSVEWEQPPPSSPVWSTFSLGDIFRLFEDEELML